MSEAIKPTPGPWSVCEHSWCDTSISAPSTDNAICRLDINHATEESQEADEAQMAANARLIGAAPELLAALRGALQLIELVVPFDGDETRNIRKAIAKATGEQP